MKMRIDFVTNSSSVSYIVSLNADMAEFIKFKTGNFDANTRKMRIYEALFNDIRKNGTPETIAGSEILTRRYDFEKKQDCKYDASFGAVASEIDFGAMSDEDLWSYIYGECLVNGRLSSEFKGFGSVQIPRDKAIFLEKRCRVITCAKCDRNGTDQCYKMLLAVNKK